jgi:hypothetical protein
MFVDREMKSVKIGSFQWHMTHTEVHKNMSILICDADVCTDTHSLLIVF